MIGQWLRYEIIEYWSETSFSRLLGISLYRGDSDEISGDFSTKDFSTECTYRKNNFTQ